MNRTARTAVLALSVSALCAAPALAGSSFTVVEGSAPDVVAGGVTTWFNGMYSSRSTTQQSQSLRASPRGHVTGVHMPDGRTSLDLIFGSGARIVAFSSSAAAEAMTEQYSGTIWRDILGGTGRYLGAKGEVESIRWGSGVLGYGPFFMHNVQYSLPPRGTPRTTMAYVVKLGTPHIINRGGPGGVGNTRLITGSILDAARTRVGTYGVDSTLVFVYGAGTYEWYTGTYSYEFADGTLTASGPYQRASASAPGALGASGRVVSSGTGAYSGMRGQVVVTANPDGTATHSFTLIRR